MGWNAGGFGQMSFPSLARAQQWQAARRSHSDWDDWIGELELGEDEPFVVSELLDQFAGRHDPANHEIYLIELNDTEVELVFNVGEDDFRDYAATLAALLRSAETCDANGKFWFLGTAGAEYDFVYQLNVGAGRSEIKVLSGRQIARIYEGPEYRAFSKQTTALIEEAAQTVEQMLLAIDGEDFMLRYGALRALRMLPPDYRRYLGPQVTNRLALLATADAPAPAGMAGGPSIVDVVKDHDLRETLPALAAFACSGQPVDARDAAAELIIEWNDRGSLAAVATRINEAFGIGVTAARALILFDPEGALTELVATAASTTGGQDEADRRLHHLLKALTAEAAKAGKQSLIHRDPRWIAPVLGLLDLGDNYLAHNALSLLEYSPRDPQVLWRLEALLRAGAMPPIPVTQTLRALRSKSYKAIIKERLTVATDEREIEQLRLCL
jgi:hypothetical protein